MIYDRRAVMSVAWAIVRRLAGNGAPLAENLSRALRCAWEDARTEARLARMAAERDAERKALEARPADELLAQIIVLECKSVLRASDYDRLRDLQHAYSVAVALEAQEAADADLAHKRALIASAKGRFCSVTFTKKDGTERVIRVQPAALKFHIKGDGASEAGQKAAATRAARYPHLLPVWDSEAQAPRSINLETVSRITVNGQAHHFGA